MKKTKSLPLIVAALSLPLCCGCIRSEALNCEADIVECSIADTTLLMRPPVIGNYGVQIYVNGSADVTAQAPRFVLSEGAAIDPPGGTERDFSTPQSYTVTSQDGAWSKEYSVAFVKQEIVTRYHFEGMRLHEGRYPVLCEESDDGNRMEWSSGNAGYAISNSDTPPDGYPTVQCDQGYMGKCVKLTTRRTSSWGEAMNAPIAAGSLFLGSFKINLSEMPRSSRMGVPFFHRPLRLTGYCKYRAGEVVTDSHMVPQPQLHDQFDIYGVLYEVTPELPNLDGTNSLSAPTIVLMARIDDKSESEQWRRFSLDFAPVEGRTLDRDKLRAGGYNLAIVFSSSLNGAQFLGAVGSTLYVDEVTLEYEEEEEEDSENETEEEEEQP